MMRRYYVSSDDISATDDELALAEELIDAYVGPQQKSLPREVIGKISTVSGKTLFDTHGPSPLAVTQGRYIDCVIEIIGGTGMGQSRFITASSGVDKSITYTGDDFAPGLDDTSVYKIYQLAKFPRYKDTRSYGSIWYKAIPEAVRQATIAQVEFIQQMGVEYFMTDDSTLSSESIGNYSYSNGNASGTSGVSQMIAPKAKAYLRGIVNRTGRLIAENPTWL